MKHITLFAALAMSSTIAIAMATPISPSYMLAAHVNAVALGMSHIGKEKNSANTEKIIIQFLVKQGDKPLLSGRFITVDGQAMPMYQMTSHNYPASVSTSEKPSKVETKTVEEGVAMTFTPHVYSNGEINLDYQLLRRKLLGFREQSNGNNLGKIQLPTIEETRISNSILVKDDVKTSETISPLGDNDSTATSGTSSPNPITLTVQVHKQD